MSVKESSSLNATYASTSKKSTSSSNKSLSVNQSKSDDAETDLVEEWRLKGNSFYKDKNYKAAADAYTKAIQQNDTIASLYSNRAAAQLMLLQFKETLNDCNLSIALDSSVAKVHFRRASALRGLGNLSEAIAAYDAGLAIDSNTESYSERTQLQNVIAQIPNLKLLVSKKEFRKALHLIDQLFRLAGSNFRDLNILKIECLIELGKIEDAYNLSNAMLRTTEVMDSDLLYHRSKCFYYMGDLENCLKNLTKAMRSDPDNNTYRLLYRKVKDIEDFKEQGNKAFKNNLYQDAINLWTSAIDLDITNRKVVCKLYSNRATALFKLKKYEEAINDCNKCLSNDPNFIKALTRRAECHFAIAGATVGSTSDQKEKLQKSLTDYEKALEMENHDESMISQIKTKIKQIKVAIKRSGRKDHYSALGIPPGADDEEIRKAYKKSALRHHPDKQAGKSDAEKATSEAAFKDISEAYEVLSDKERKDRYDQGLDDDDSGCGGEGGHGHHGMDPDMLFQMFMQQQMGGGRGGGGMRYSFG